MGFVLLGRHLRWAWNTSQSVRAWNIAAALVLHSDILYQKLPSWRQYYELC